MPKRIMSVAAFGGLTQQLIGNAIDKQPERKVRDGNMEREVQCIAEAHSFDRVCNGGTDSHTAFEI